MVNMAKKAKTAKMFTMAEIFKLAEKDRKAELAKMVKHPK